MFFKSYVLDRICILFPNIVKNLSIGNIEKDLHYCFFLKTSTTTILFFKYIFTFGFWPTSASVHGLLVPRNFPWQSWGSFRVLGIEPRLAMYKAKTACLCYHSSPKSLTFYYSYLSHIDVLTYLYILLLLASHFGCILK